MSQWNENSSNIFINLSGIDQWSLHDSSCLFSQSNWYDTEYSDCYIQFWKQSVKFSSFSLLSSWSGFIQVFLKLKEVE